MAKFDEKLNRMNYLMEFRSPSNKPVNNPVEYHTVGADGKVYGILREGTKYYIKTTEKGKETLAESYDYINGLNNKKNCEYSGYNEATKQLELKLMSLNEAYGVKKNVSTVNINKSQENFSYLTEEARKELDRMNQIFENSGKIGKDNTTPVEYHGTASPDNTAKNNAPFSNAAKATLDKDLKDTESNPASATGEGYTNASKNINADLQSTKMKGRGESGNQCFEKNVKDSDVDSEGTAVAAQKKEGAKSVKMNEGMYDDIDDDPNEFLGPENDVFGHPEMLNSMNDYVDDDTLGDEPFADSDDDYDIDDDDELAGDNDIEDDDYDMEQLISEMEQTYQGGNFSNKNKDIITGPEDTLDGPNTTDKKSNSVAYGEKHVGPDNGVMNEEDEMIDECDVMPDNVISENEDNTEPEGPTEDAMQGPDIHGTKTPFGAKDGSLAYGEKRVGQMDESMIEGLVSDVCRKLLGESKKTIKKAPKKKETLQEAIQRIVNEELTRLDYWGKHPRYQNEPMQLPPNKEVMKGTADRDWNDDSAKGNQPYGQRIGDSAPFNQKVDAITNSVLQTLKETAKRNRR